MDFQKQIYAKTPSGDEAVRQSSHVVDRNLRMVLVQVDGKLSVGELGDKIGNRSLVEQAIRALERGGFIAPVSIASEVWEATRRIRESQFPPSVMSRFPNPGPASILGNPGHRSLSSASAFSTFGKPILPTLEGEQSGGAGKERPKAPSVPINEPPVAAKRAFPWGKVIAGGVLGLPVLAGLAVVFYPYDSLRPGMEQAVSNALQQPVRFRKVELQILPKPVLVVHDMTLGQDTQPLVGQLRIPSPWSLLGSNNRRIEKLEASQIRLPVDRLLSLPLLRGMPLAGNAFRIDQVVLRDLRIDAAGMSPGELGGEFALTAGRLEALTLYTADRVLTANLAPSGNGFTVQFEGYGWRPAETIPRLDSIRARGTLQAGQLSLSEVDLRMLGGGVKGAWQLDWSNGVHMRADAGLSMLDPRQIAAAFAPGLRMDGPLSGVLRLSGQGRSADSMLSQLEASLDVDVQNGVLHGVDLGEAARRSGSAPVRGGATKFERLRTQVTVQPNLVSFRNIQVASGIFNASGQASANRGSGAIDGQFNVTIHSTLSSLRANVAVSGRLPDLTASGSK